jgi:hypothetical protein
LIAAAPSVPTFDHGMFTAPVVADALPAYLKRRCLAARRSSFDGLS